MWSSGALVRFRYVRDGRAFWELPVRVVADTSEELALWIAPNTPMLRPDPPRVGVPALAAGTWEAVASRWAGEGVLMVRRPDTRHSLWHFWSTSGEFHAWYVNLEDWWRDDEGLDAYDHQLDIWVYADGRWEWKDEDDLAQSVEAGIFTSDEAEAIRAEGERVIAEWPFPTGWESWRAEPSWDVV